MKFKDIVNKDNIAIHTKTEDQAIKLLTEADKLDLKWQDGNSYLHITNWWLYKSFTCYDFSDGSFSDFEFFIDAGYKIIDFETLIFDEEQQIFKYTLEKVIKDLRSLENISEILDLNDLLAGFSGNLIYDIEEKENILDDIKVKIVECYKTLQDLIKEQ